MTDFQPPENIGEFLKNPHFARYYNTWQKNERSLVFIPLAEYFRAKGFLREALSLCQSGLSFNPQSISGRLALARVYLEMEKKEEAKDLLGEILTELPGQQEAMLLLARLQGPSPLPEGEVLNPWDTCTMAEIYARQGEHRRAIGIVEKILAHNPSHLKAKELKETWKSSSSTAQI